MSMVPLEQFHDLSSLSEAGYQLSLHASPDERRRLAEWAGVDEIAALAARIDVRPLSKTRFLVETEFEADIVQSCVVTLAPVHAHIARTFTRELHLARGTHRFADKGGLVPPAAGDDKSPEEIESSRYDLAAPLREELVLAIDPYPRVPGVAFEGPGHAEQHAESPFAILENFRRPS